MDERAAPAPTGERNVDVEKRKAWLRETLAAMEDAVVVTDANACISFLNAAAAVMTGWTLEQVRGTALSACLQFIDADTGKPLEPPNDALRTGVSIALPVPALVVGKHGCEYSIEPSLCDMPTRLQTRRGVCPNSACPRASSSMRC